MARRMALIIASPREAESPLERPADDCQPIRGNLGAGRETGGIALRRPAHASTRLRAMRLPASCVHSWIAANRTQIDEMVEQRSRWWIPRTIDRRIAATMHAWGEKNTDETIVAKRSGGCACRSPTEAAKAC